MNCHSNKIIGVTREDIKVDNIDTFSHHYWVLWTKCPRKYGMNENQVDIKSYKETQSPALGFEPAIRMAFENLLYFLSKKTPI